MNWSKTRKRWNSFKVARKAFALTKDQQKIWDEGYADASSKRGFNQKFSIDNVGYEDSLTYRKGFEKAQEDCGY